MFPAFKRKTSRRETDQAHGLAGDETAVRREGKARSLTRLLSSLVAAAKLLDSGFVILRPPILAEELASEPRPEVVVDAPDGRSEIDFRGSDSQVPDIQIAGEACLGEDEVRKARISVNDNLPGIRPYEGARRGVERMEPPQRRCQEMNESVRVLRVICTAKVSSPQRSGQEPVPLRAVSEAEHVRNRDLVR